MGFNLGRYFTDGYITQEVGRIAALNKKEGADEGILKGVETVAINMMSAGMADEQISLLTNLEVTAIALIRAKLPFKD